MLECSECSYNASSYTWGGGGISPWLIWLRLLDGDAAYPPPEPHARDGSFQAILGIAQCHVWMQKRALWCSERSHSRTVLVLFCPDFGGPLYLTTNLLAFLAFTFSQCCKLHVEHFRIRNGQSRSGPRCCQTVQTTDSRPRFHLPSCQCSMRSPFYPSRSFCGQHRGACECSFCVLGIKSLFIALPQLNSDLGRARLASIWSLSLEEF